MVTYKTVQNHSTEQRKRTCVISVGTSVLFCQLVQRQELRAGMQRSGKSEALWVCKDCLQRQLANASQCAKQVRADPGVLMGRAFEAAAFFALPVL